MITQLKSIRDRLQDAVNAHDWWVIKSQINIIDTILYKNYKQNEDKNNQGA